MTIFGIGLLMVASGGFSLGLILLLEAVGGVRLTWTTTHDDVLIPLGAIFAAVGFYFWLSGVRMVRKAFYEEKLMTEGVYAYTRNPMYAAFILFLIPALSLLMNDVLIILTSAILYAVFRINIGKEEDFLQRQFGEDYRRYAEKVPRLIPRFVRPKR
ncbi:MAG TPA: isoprenylcysteine carboxylmethyltransferase family protein [Syntrophales bacterium]|jgi:protein-S-isoprenylcysteine O-methyltransferase Ste14|nr:isoprenylcysteine carboxylmethyltransferase family protein [Syntrophales bacterium]HQA82598.1 isoprenylcysteine carboxylmethyltransferase family protein [Syntrophales bacterium]